MTSCALILLVVGGCAYRRGALAGSTERVIATRHELQREAQPVIQVEQEGTHLALFGEHRCRAHRHERVETTLHYGRSSAISGLMITTSVLGGLAIGGGSLLVANVFGFPSDGTYASMDSLTAEEALIGGAILIAAGGVAVITAAAHAFGLLGTDDERTEAEVHRGPTGPVLGCDPPEPLAGARVRLVGSGGTAELGRLSPAGELNVDAGYVLEPAFVLQSGTHARLEVDEYGSDASVTLAPFHARAESRAWARAQSARCAAASEPDDCVPLERYLGLFPDGANAAQGRAVLEQAHVRLAERARRLEAEREAEAERQRVEEERRLAEAEAQRAAYEAEQRARQEAYEAEQRARQEAYERERRAREAEAAARAQEAAERARRREMRAACASTCRSTCAGDAECIAVCQERQCR